jgi:hypothetical protein
MVAGQTEAQIVDDRREKRFLNVLLMHFFVTFEEQFPAPLARHLVHTAHPLSKGSTSLFPSL